jgi:hypothetical protein
MKVSRTIGMVLFVSALIVGYIWLFGEHCTYHGEYGDPDTEECHYGITLELTRIAQFLRDRF